jgi:fluoride ion exporter CrcB/FEX
MMDKNGGKNGGSLSQQSGDASNITNNTNRRGDFQEAVTPADSNNTNAAAAAHQTSTTRAATITTTNTNTSHFSSPPPPPPPASPASPPAATAESDSITATQQQQQQQQQQQSQLHQQQQHGGASSRVGGGKEEEEDWRTVLEDAIAKPGREALQNFFYPPVRHRTDAASAAAAAATADDSIAHSSGGTTTTSRRFRRRPLTDSSAGVDEQNGPKDPLESPSLNNVTSGTEQFQNEPEASQPQHATSSSSSPHNSDAQHNNNNTTTTTTTTSELFDQHFYQQALEDRKLVEHIWTIYDDIIILSLFTQVGIVARLGVSTWFSYFNNGVFSNNSPLFVNLPLNCLSCFIMGMLCSGERLMEIITTRFSPPQLQQQIHNNSNNTFNIEDDNDDDSDNDDDKCDDNDEEMNGEDRTTNSISHRSPKGRLRLPMHDGGFGGGGTSSDDGNGRSVSGGHSSDEDGLYATTASPESNTTSGGGGLFSGNALRRRRRRQRRRRRRGDGRRQKRGKSSTGATNHNSDSWFHSWQPPVHVNEDLRDVQLLALERRIRLSKCLLLFPVKKEDVDVMEHYFQQGYKKEHHHHYDRQGHMNHSYGEEEENDEYCASSEQPHQHGPDSMQRWRGDQGAGRLDDLVLEERVVAPSPAFKHIASKATSTPNSSLGSHVPSATTTTNDGNPAIVSPKKEAESKAAVDPLMGASPSIKEIIDRDERVTDMTTVELNQASPTGKGQQRQQQQQQQQQPGVVTSPQDSVSNTNTSLYGDKPAQDLNQMVNDVQANVTENITRLRRVDIADGWDVGTTPEAMSDDLMLGLRDGFCGALSSFSSWNSAMVNLLRSGNVGAALVGYILGLQLPIIAYRFGQHVAVYIFIWRCRRETKRDERRGYGIRVSMNEYSERDMYCTSGSAHGSMEMVDTNGVDDAASTSPSGNPETSPQHSMRGGAGGAYALPAETNHVERETPSIRAVATALFIIALVTQCTSISFYTDYESQVVALSLLFSPLGVFARWRLSKYNSWRLSFPIGTFTANMLACALSGGLGRLLAGNPGERERLGKLQHCQLMCSDELCR